MIKKVGILILIISIALTTFSSIVNAKESSTNVSIISDKIIQDVSPDRVISVGDDTTLFVVTSTNNVTYRWLVSKNQGLTYNDTSNDSNTLQIVNAVENNPPQIPYYYKVIVDNGISKEERIIKVFVANDYSERTLNEENTDIEVEVTATMHKQTHLVITSRDENSEDYQALSKYVNFDNGFEPLSVQDVSLVNQDNRIVPFFGKLKISFKVGDMYNGLELRVLHLINKRVEIYSSIVSNGTLEIVVDSLSPFLVEVPATKKHILQADSDSNGTITPTGSIKVPDGEDKTFIFNPNIGYVVDKVVVDTKSISVTGNSYTFKNIKEDHTIYVNYKLGQSSQKEYTIVSSSDTNGKVSPSGVSTVQQGDSRTFYFYPNNGYEIDTVYINNQRVKVLNNSYTLTSIQTDINLYVTFKKQIVIPPLKTYTVTDTCGKGGSIFPSGKIKVPLGGDLYIYLKPDKGFEVKDVFINGIKVNVQGNMYHLININNDKTIYATFQKEVNAVVKKDNDKIDNMKDINHNIYIKLPDGSHGSISPNGIINVPDGGSQTFYFYPEKGYQLNEVYINGKKVDITAGYYTLENIKSDVTIDASFIPINHEDNTKFLCQCPCCYIVYKIFPNMNCLCPWCWVIPSVFLIILFFIFLKKIKNKTIHLKDNS